ncbi:MAG: hypothetical protein ACKVP2_13955 [Burkholderiales bacterium]
MPRYKSIDTGMTLLPFNLCVQLLPGTFEHALSHLINHELDLRSLDGRFNNNASGAPAHAPSVLLKVTLFTFYNGPIRRGETTWPARRKPQSRRARRGEPVGRALGLLNYGAGSGMAF